MRRLCMLGSALCRGLAAGAILLLLAGNARAELVLFYDFNDAADPDVAVDVSGKGNNGDVIDAEFTAAGEGRTGAAGDRAMDFGDFNNDAMVEVPSAADGAFDSLTENDTATVMMWIFGGEEQPVDQWTWYIGQGATRQLSSHIPWSNGNIYFDVAGCCNPDQRIEQNEPDDSLYKGEWNHYAFVKDTEDTAIYQNGELWLDSTASGPKAPLDVIDVVRIGAGPDGDIRSYNGLIDDFGIWDEALTEAQIRRHHGEWHRGTRRAGPAGRRRRSGPGLRPVGPGEGADFGQVPDRGGGHLGRGGLGRCARRQRRQSAHG